MIDLAGSSSLYMQRAVSMCVCAPLCQLGCEMFCVALRGCKAPTDPAVHITACPHSKRNILLLYLHIMMDARRLPSKLDVCVLDKYISSFSFFSSHQQTAGYFFSQTKTELFVSFIFSLFKLSLELLLNAFKLNSTETFKGTLLKSGTMNVPSNKQNNYIS